MSAAAVRLFGPVSPIERDSIVPVKLQEMELNGDAIETKLKV